MVELLIGPVYYHLLLGTCPIDPEESAVRVDWLIHGLRPFAPLPVGAG